jgi:hypothetical protein
MKLYVIKFDKPQKFDDVKLAAKEGDRSAVVTINRSTGLTEFEVQSEKAAYAITKKVGGKVEIIDYKAKDIYK